MDSELLKEAQVVLKKQTQIIHAIAQHRQTLHSHTKGKASVCFRIDAAVGEHRRMHHAAAHHLEPASLAADTAASAAALHTLDVHLGRGLGKREIGRSETHRQITLEEHLEELFDQALQVGKAGLLSHQQALDLMKHRRVGEV